MQMTRALSVVFQVAIALAALWICGISLLLLSRIWAVDGASRVQQGLIAIIAVSFAASAVCWAIRVRVRYLAWLADGRWPGPNDHRLRRWGRSASVGWGTGLAALALLTASYLVR